MIKTNDELATEVEDAATPMDLSWDGQRTYAVRLGLIPDGDREAWWKSRDAQDVARLLDAMRKQADAMASAKGWMLSSLEHNDQRMLGREVHSVGHLDTVARHALDYDAALAVYVALEEQLRALVSRIRHEQGYEPSAWSRLEEHPALSPEDDQAVRALSELSRHLTQYESASMAELRRHLTGIHGRKPAEVRHLTQPELADAHETAEHGTELATLRGKVAAIEEAEAAR
jgi:hypothetical protein